MTFVDFVTSVPADWLNNVNFVVNQFPFNSNGFVVNNIAGLRAIDHTKTQSLFVLGYVTQGDGGGGIYYYDPTDTTSADNGGTIIVANDTARWKLATQEILTSRQFGASGGNSTDSSIPLQFLLANTLDRGFWLPAGQYKFGTGLTANYSSLAFPNPGSPSARLDLIGESISNTILNYSGTGYAMSLTGGDNAGISQGIVSMDKFSNFTLQDFAQAKSNNGMVLTNKAWWEISNILIQQMQVGLNLTSCYSSKVRSSFFNLNNYGIFLDTTALGPSNEISFDSLVLQSNSLAGVLGSSIGSCLSFRDVAFESNGTQGNLSTGGFVGNMSGVYGNAGPITFDNCYFENNAGVADISIDNTSAFALTIIIRGCLFQRISSTNYTRNNISVTSSGGGPVTVLLEGNSFFSTGSYVPNAARPFWAGSANVLFRDMGGNIFSEITSLPSASNIARTYPIGATVFAGGTGTVSYANNVTVSRTGTGAYTVTFVTPQQTAAYIPMITMDRGGNGAMGYSITAQSTTSFSFTTTNQAGSATDPTSVWVEVF